MVAVRSVGVAGPLETSLGGEHACCALCRCGRVAGADFLSVGMRDQSCWRGDVLCVVAVR